MSRGALPAVIVALSMVASLDARAAAPLSAGDVIPGEVVASFAPSGAASRAAAVAAVDGDWGDAVRGVPGTRVIELSPRASVADAVDALNALPGVRWAEPNYVYETVSVPNDPLFGDLWGMRNVGQEVNGVAGVPGIDLNALPAWDWTTGSPAVRVAVVDSGIDPSHPDLEANLNHELSRNFYPDDEASGADPAAWADLNLHGTHVAGTIGASGDNGIGVSGVNWRTELVGGRICGMAGSCSSVAIAEGFAHAGAIGAKVANGSIGGPERSYAAEAAIAAYPGTLYVFAAGNESRNVDAEPSYPCNYPQANIICVAALDSSGGLASFSNYGRAQVDVGAPGVDILSTTPNLQTRFDGSGGLGKWAQDPAGRWIYDAEHDTYDFDSQPESAALTSAAPIDLEGVEACRLSYGLNLDSLEGRQRLFVEASSNGTDWVQVQQLPDGYAESGGETVPLTEDLRRFDGEGTVWVRYRLQSDAVGQNQNVTLWIESPRVVCIAPMPPQGAYQLSSGTSMASPGVAGVAALAWSAHPGASAAEIRAAILGSVVPTPSLAGVTVTGGRVDAAATLAALAKPTSPIPAPSPVDSRAPWALGLAASHRIPVSGGGRAQLRIRCRAHAASRCHGRLVLVGKVRPGPDGGARRVALAARPYRLAAGHTKARALWLRPHAARLLRQGRLHRYRLLVRTTQPEGAKRKLRTNATTVGLRQVRTGRG